MPMAMMSMLRSPGARVMAAVLAGAGSMWRFFTGAVAAPLTFSMSSSRTARRSWLARAVGFWTKSTAPASMASRTISASAEEALRRRMGIGVRDICWRTNSTPPRRGMVRSQVMTSGFSSAVISRASTPSRAMPTTSMKGLRESISRTTLRTKGESSTTSVRMMPEGGKLETDIDKGVSLLVQFEISGEFKKGFGGADEKMAARGHAGGEGGDGLANCVRGKIDEDITTENGRAAGQGGDFFRGEKIGAMEGDAAGGVGIQFPFVAMRREIFLFQSGRKATEGFFTIDGGA